MVVHKLGKLLSPWGRTTRGHYWLALLGLAAGTFGVAEVKDYIGTITVVIAIVALQIIVSVATLRRLHDAGWSRWWALLCMFPVSITWDLIHLQVSTATWQFVDISAAVRHIPVLVGLFAASRPIADDDSLRNAFA